MSKKLCVYMLFFKYTFFCNVGEVFVETSMGFFHLKASAKGPWKRAALNIAWPNHNSSNGPDLVSIF